MRGFGYDDVKLGRHPTCRDLDRASVNHPIVIRHGRGTTWPCATASRYRRLESAAIRRTRQHIPAEQKESPTDTWPNRPLD